MANGDVLEVCYLAIRYGALAGVAFLAGDLLVMATTSWRGFDTWLILVAAAVVGVGLGFARWRSATIE
jgi:hypothetical protein